MAYKKACRVRVHLEGLIVETSTSNGMSSLVTFKFLGRFRRWWRVAR